MQQALDKADGGQGRTGAGLQSIPRNRRDGETLVTFISHTVTSERVFLAESTKSSLDRFILEQKQRRVLEKHGLKPKSKVLFWGPPGCGKTLTANLIGTELGLPVGLVRLSSLITSYVGETAANLQRVFSIASSTPMVLLLDEIDSIAKDRDDRNDVGELKRVVNSLLQAVDSFSCDKSILVAASNHQYMLDEAVWRRFDEVIEFPLPAHRERQEFLRFLLSGVTFTASYTGVSRQLAGLSFADIEAVVYEAVKTKILEEHEAITSDAILREIRAFKEKRKRARHRATRKP